MRLTLRTLLAYLDDILDPADKEQLAKKIETSEFAEDLVHRTRDAVRRLRLSAPQVIGSGMGLDPNTVAEYLDNVLPPESVGDFERICLESDMHLAEAAACHHVLTMVLGEPADVDPLARQRMYTIATEGESRRRLRVEAAHVAVATEPVVGPPVQVVASPAGVVEESGVTELPDYLRASRWSGSRMVLSGVAAVLVVGAALFLVSGMGGWFGRDGGQTATALRADTTANALNTTNAGAQETQPVGTVAEDESTGSMNEVAPRTDAPPSELPSGLNSPPQPVTPGITPSTTTATDRGAGEQTLPIGSEPIATAPAADDATEASSVAANSVAANSNDVPADVDAGAVAALPTDVADTSVVPETVAADAAAGPTGGDTGSVVGIAPGTESPDAEEAPAGPAELGTYLGGKTVLLRYNDEAGGWFRVQPRSAVIAGDRLLALPQFRPKITLASGVHLDVSGGTQVAVRGADELAAEGLPAAAADVPAVEVVYGRVILINTSNVQNRVRLALGSNVGEARLARNATLAIEVERSYVPGHDPRQSPAPVIVRLYVPNGGVEWQDASGTKKIDNTSRWTIEEGAASDVVADSSPPDWIDQEPTGQRSEQLYGAPVVENTMASDKPADIQLLELFQSNARKEVKSLAAKSSVHVGLFEPFIDALRDSEQKANWTAHIETLRGAMALSPESAANVKRALVEQRGQPAADDMYEMLCGYNADQVGRTPDEVRSGALERLIDWLEQDSLDYRVLAVHDLWEITGKRLMPDPAANLKERTQNVRRWRSRLEEGDLLPARR